MAKAPTGVTVFSYHVGFGDCFLLEFQYPDRDRYMLIDFGSTGFPDGTPKTRMMDIANDIATRCNGKLAAVVATHRHKDHLSGFTTNAKHTASGDVIRGLNPGVVVQPWTEQPELNTDAPGPAGSPELKSMRAFGRNLRFAQKFSREVLSVLESPGARRWPKALRDQLGFLGESNLANLSAVKNLMSMGKKRVYVYHGFKLGLATLLPGVKVRVLGPPTLRQTKSIEKQRSSDPDEFWQLHLRRLTEDVEIAAGNETPFPKAPFRRGSQLPYSARWLSSRVKTMRGEQLLALVRELDQQMNNTSVILLIEAAGKKLLFPGDAQIENWAFALGQPGVKKLLADVDLYKVGHHGSRNATPRSMWSEFANRGASGKKGRLKTALSTLPGKHGSVQAKSEVPRTTLLHELESLSDLHNTDDLPTNKLFNVIQV